MRLGILLSGGMDSIALAKWKRPSIAFTVNYGQVCAEAELRAAAIICDELGIQHEIIVADCQKLGRGDLAGLPPSALSEIPEWWPFRNQLLITLAAMRAATLGVNTVLLGTVQSDGVHKDGRKEFIEGIDQVVSMQEGGLRIFAPAIDMTSAELIQESGIEMSLLAWAHSCHVSNYACGRCRGCFKHRSTMSAIGYEAY